MQLQNQANSGMGISPRRGRTLRNWKGRTLRGVLIALLVMAGSFAWHYSEIPRSLVYSAFRSMNKYGVNLQTRNWNSLKGEHFEVRYRKEDADIAQIVLAAAEEAVAPVNSQLGYRPQGRMLVLVYPDRTSLGKSFGWTADQSAMGVYWAGVIRVLSPSVWITEVSLSEKAEVFSTAGPMVHEYTHLAVDYMTRGNYPRWFTEGVAQYVEREVTGFTLSEPPPGCDQAWFSVEALEVSFDSPATQSQAYYQSLTMVDFLTQEYGSEVVVGILNCLGKGIPLDSAWEAETGVTVETFEASFAERTLSSSPDRLSGMISNY